MIVEEDPKWQLCSLICLNKGQEIYSPDVDIFCNSFILSDDVKDQLHKCKVYCECCRILKRYAFLFCKYYTGEASFILICSTCENYDGEECTILDQIIESEAKRLACQDRYMLLQDPPSN